MVKRRWAILFFLLFFINYINFINAQDVGVNTTSLESDAKKIRNTTAKIQEFTEREKWEFLADQWKEFLLKNEGFAAFDAFMKKISFIFFIFLGMSYEFSPLFFAIVFLWFFHFWILSSIILSYSPLKKSVGILVSAGSLIILSQIKYMVFVSEIFLNIALWGEGIWRLFSFLLSLLIILLILGVVKYILQRKKQSLEEIQKLQEKVDRETLHKTAKGIRGEHGFLEDMFERWREMGEAGY